MAMVCKLTLPLSWTRKDAAYPHPDVNVRDFFTNHANELSDEEFQKRYTAFFCSLFDHTHALLSKFDHQSTISLWWYNHLNRNAMRDLPDPNRVSFYDHVISEARV